MIRFAIEKDIPKIIDLLKQVCLVHHKGRLDIFKVSTKYSAEELKVILKDESRPNGIDIEIIHFYSTVTNKTLFRFYETVFSIYKDINLVRY